jgi:hypothetical protein
MLPPLGEIWKGATVGVALRGHPVRVPLARGADFVPLHDWLQVATNGVATEGHPYNSFDVADLGMRCALRNTDLLCSELL